MPSPLLFGTIVDTACVTSDLPCGKHGACLLYDMEAFRYRVHGFAIGIKFTAFSLYVVAYLLNMCRTRRRVGDQKGGHTILPGEPEDDHKKIGDHKEAGSTDPNNKKTGSTDLNNNHNTGGSTHIIWDEQIVKKLLKEKNGELHESVI